MSYRWIFWRNCLEVPSFQMPLDSVKLAKKLANTDPISKLFFLKIKLYVQKGGEAIFCVLNSAGHFYATQSSQMVMPGGVHQWHCRVQAETHSLQFLGYCSLLRTRGGTGKFAPI